MIHGRPYNTTRKTRDQTSSLASQNSIFTRSLQGERRKGGEGRKRGEAEEERGREDERGRGGRESYASGAGMADGRVEQGGGKELKVEGEE